MGNIVNQCGCGEREKQTPIEERIHLASEEPDDICEEIDELIKKAGIQNNGTITNNIQNNIKLLAYKDTDISKLSDNDFIKCINHNNMCIPQLIKMIHLNPQKPENHNIYISNLKNGYIMLYDGKKWNTFNRDEMINNMIDEKQTIIEEKIEEDFLIKRVEEVKTDLLIKKEIIKIDNIKMMMAKSINLLSSKKISIEIKKGFLTKKRDFQGEDKILETNPLIK